jgi:hypothetical protein
MLLKNKMLSNRVLWAWCSWICEWTDRLLICNACNLGTWCQKCWRNTCIREYRCCTLTVENKHAHVRCFLSQSNTQDKFLNAPLKHYNEGLGNTVESVLIFEMSTKLDNWNSKQSIHGILVHCRLQKPKIWDIILVQHMVNNNFKIYLQLALRAWHNYESTNVINTHTASPRQH